MCVVVVTTMKLQERLTSTEFELHSVNHRLLQLTATPQHADDISCRQVRDGCMPHLSLPQIVISTVLLLKPQVSVTQAVLVVGVARWPVILTGWPVTVGVVEVGVFNMLRC